MYFTWSLLCKITQCIFPRLHINEWLGECVTGWVRASASAFPSECVPRRVRASVSACLGECVPKPPAAAAHSMTRTSEASKSFYSRCCCHWRCFAAVSNAVAYCYTLATCMQSMIIIILPVSDGRALLFSHEDIWLPVHEDITDITSRILNWYYILCRSCDNFYLRALHTYIKHYNVCCTQGETRG